MNSATVRVKTGITREIPTKRTQEYGGVNWQVTPYSYAQQGEK